MKKLVLSTSTLRELTDNELKSVVGGLPTGSCGGGKLSCCRTFQGQESCDQGVY